MGLNVNVILDTMITKEYKHVSLAVLLAKLVETIILTIVYPAILMEQKIDFINLELIHAHVLMATMNQ